MPWNTQTFYNISFKKNVINFAKSAVSQNMFQFKGMHAVYSSDVLGLNNTT